ncbi:amidohydrolase family protein [Herbiconiux sp. VKM Ac-1786]|uniref:amidohydrolase family protein n=1 Tax=Herbiconiux sp. VKM Ac-1786 TaxID=2783824 RepID=UPI00188B7AA6|nr:amidohydrolase family protein [Herbiconiux sp. VKM Ac-1786]MBF4571835.1 amidohydrolase family protein [Herbiconiux sp. VKM Ac-1786]
MIVDLHAHLGARKRARYSGEEILRDMDAAGVDHACVFSFVESLDNHYPARQAAEHPDRFTAFCMVDPWNPDSATAMRRCFEQGMRGVKFHPMRQAVAVDRVDVMAPFLDLCEEFGAVFFAHGSSESFNSPGKFARLARRWPTVPIVIGHSGGPWGLPEAIDVATDHPNVRLSTSLVPVPALRRIVDRIGPERLLLASDVPFGSFDFEIAKVRAAVPETADLVLGGNLARLIGLTAVAAGGVGGLAVATS